MGQRIEQNMEQSMGQSVEQGLDLGMKQSKRQNVVDAITENKIIVIIRGLEKEDALRTVEALYKGGIRLVEFAFAPNQSDQKSKDILDSIAHSFQDVMHIGAGSVTTETRLDFAIQAGAEYIISPDTNETIIRKTKCSGLVSIPGALTPTEITTAWQLGADFVKVFPVNAMNENYLKDILAPLGYINMLSVGGVNPDNIAHYLSLGMKGVGIGGGLVDKNRITQKNFAYITNLAQRCVSECRKG